MPPWWYLAGQRPTPGENVGADGSPYRDNPPARYSRASTAGPVGVARRVGRERHGGVRPTRLALVVTCAECGLPIVLAADKQGIVLANRDEFLVTHERCLAARPLDGNRR